MVIVHRFRMDFAGPTTIKKPHRQSQEHKSPLEIHLKSPALAVLSLACDDLKLDSFWIQ